MGVVVKGGEGARAAPIKVDADGHIQADVLSSALPSGAATETTLAAIKARLESPQIGYGVNPGIVYAEVTSGGGSVNVEPVVVPNGKTYVLTSVYAIDWTSAIDGIRLYLVTATDYVIIAEVLGPSAGQTLCWSGQIVIPEGTTVRARFYGTVSGDVLWAGCTYHELG